MFIMHVLSLYDINSLEKYAGSLKLSRALEPPIRDLNWNHFIWWD